MPRIPTHLSRRVVGVAALAVVTSASLALSAPSAGARTDPAGDGKHPHGHGGRAQQAEDRRAARLIRRATEKYEDVDRAIADGYVPTDACVEEPGAGGMGYHYVNPALAADSVVDPDKPEMIVYYTDRTGRLRLGAAEWFVADPDQDLSTDTGRPTLFGHPFDGPMAGHEPGMPVHFDLHVWVGTHNPNGLFAPWNPRVSCS